jgi:hypothetical protein
LTLKSKHWITTKPDSHFWQTNLGENLTPKLNNCESFKTGSKNRVKMNPVGIRYILLWVLMHSKVPLKYVNNENINISGPTREELETFLDTFHKR